MLPCFRLSIAFIVYASPSPHLLHDDNDPTLTTPHTAPHRYHTARPAPTVHVHLSRRKRLHGPVRTPEHGVRYPRLDGNVSCVFFVFLFFCFLFLDFVFLEGGGEREGERVGVLVYWEVGVE